MKVYYLASDKASFTSSESAMMLREKFGPENVNPLPSYELRRLPFLECDLLFLPGIPGEDSPYPDILTPAIKARIYKKIEQGMILWTDCAATYEMMSAMRYRASDGTIKERAGLDWIGGTADGPIEGYALTPNVHERFQHVTLRQIFYSVGSEQRTAWSAYGNGPGLRLSPEELKNPDVKIISRYGPDDESPAATVTKKIGNGLLLSLGVLVQIGPYHAGGQAQRTYSEDAYVHRAEIHKLLTQNNVSRLAYIDHIFDIVQGHYNGLKSHISQQITAPSGNSPPALVKAPA